MGKMKETAIDMPTAAAVPARATSTTVATTESNAWIEYGEAVAANAIVGDLLKFSKGDYVAGQDAREVPLGSQFVVNMDTLEIGFIKWQDNRPAGRRMGLVAERFRPPHRSE